MEVDCVAWKAEAERDWQSHWVRDYLEAGRQGYRDHYCHLWPKGDPSPYLSRNFTEDVLRKELGLPGVLHWVVYVEGTAAGICKVDLTRESKTFHPGRALFLEKIYFKNEYTGKGLGHTMLEMLAGLARQKSRTGIWLEAMQKGPALDFYRKQGFEILGTTAVPYPEVLEEEKPMWILGKEF